jgi:hypothetical protein
MCFTKPSSAFGGRILNPTLSKFNVRLRLLNVAAYRYFIYIATLSIPLRQCDESLSASALDHSRISRESLSDDFLELFMIFDLSFGGFPLCEMYIGIPVFGDSISSALPQFHIEPCAERIRKQAPRVAALRMNT